MSYKIRYSHRALNEYESILDYLIHNFGLQKTIKIDSYFDQLIQQIANNPKMYPISDHKKGIRKCVISQQTSLYYRISGKYIELISFRGNQMNSNTLNL